jgi:hypothetical protein
MQFSRWQWLIDSALKSHEQIGHYFSYSLVGIEFEENGGESGNKLNQAGWRLAFQFGCYGTASLKSLFPECVSETEQDSVRPVELPVHQS